MSKDISFDSQELIQTGDSTNATNSTPVNVTKSTKIKNFFKSVPNKLKKTMYGNNTLELNINNFADRVVKHAKYKISDYFDPNVTLPVFYNSKLFELINSVFKTSYNNDNVMNQLNTEYKNLVAKSNDKEGTKEFYRNMTQKLMKNLNANIIDSGSDIDLPLIKIKISRLVEDIVARINSINVTYRENNPIDVLVNLYIVHKILQDRPNHWLMNFISPLKYFWNLYPSTKIALFLVIIIYVLIIWFQSQLIKTTSTKVLIGSASLGIFALIFILKPLINLILPEYLTDMYYLRQFALFDLDPQLNAANDSEMRRSKCTINNRGASKDVDCALLGYLETGPQGILKTAIKVVNQHAAEMTKLHQGAFKNIEEIAQGNYSTPGEQNLPSDLPVFSADELGDKKPQESQPQESQSFNTVDPQ